MARRKKIDTSVFASTDALSIDNLSDALGNWEATQPKIERSVWGFQKPLDSFSIAAETILDKLCKGMLPCAILEKTFGNGFDAMKSLINSGAASAGMVIKWDASHPEYAGDFVSIRTPQKREKKD